MEPMWGIPYVLYNFYLSLYMKAQGVSDQQIGFLISLGFLSGVVFSFFAGMLTDALGRKRTTLIFDLLAWPTMIAIYMASRSFPMFALATVVGSTVRIVGVSWNMLVIEDATTEERVAAFNLINIINVSMGIFTPLAGVLIKTLGIIAGERILMAFAALSMAAMMLIRNHYLEETQIGQEILAERRHSRQPASRSVFMFYGRIFEALRSSPARKMILAVTILFNTYVPLGTFASLYYGPYLTEVLRLDKAGISLLGGIHAAVMLAILSLVTPAIAGGRRVRAMILGLVLQAVSLLLLIVIPRRHFGLAVATIALFAVGFGLFRPFLDSTLAEVTQGRARAGFYALQNLAVSLLCAAMGSVSGFLYHWNPISIYLVSIGILLVCTAILLSYSRRERLEQEPAPLCRAAGGAP